MRRVTRFLLMVSLFFTLSAHSSSLLDEYNSLLQQKQQVTSYQNLHALENFQAKLKTFHNKLNRCIDQNEQKAKDLVAIINKPKTILNGKFELDGKEMPEITARLKNHVAAVSECSLLKLELENEQDLVQSEVQKLRHEQFFSATESISTAIHSLSTAPEVLKQFSWENVSQNLSLNDLSYTQSIVIPLVIILLAIALFSFSYFKLNFKTYRPLKNTFVAMVFFSITGFLFHSQIDTPLTKNILALLFYYSGFVMMAITFLSFRIMQLYGATDSNINSQEMKSLCRFLKRLGVVFILFFISALLLRSFDVELSLRAAVQMIFQGFIFSFTFCYLLWAKAHHEKRPIRILSTKPVFYSVMALLIIALVSSLAGYYILVNFIVFNIIVTAIIFHLIYWLTISLKSQNYLLSGGRDKISVYLRELFSSHKHKAITELIIIQLIAYAYLFYGFSIFLLDIWETPDVWVTKLSRLFFDGFTVLNIPINPHHLLMAVMVYCLLMLLGRFISMRISDHKRFAHDHEAQDTLASLVMYVAFAVSFICALVLSGFNLTGVAIVAGALSVGVGLGLQSIVNNFISGVIMLIEKPVRPGDRVVIDGYEGFVKKISIRATQIETLLREDIIVPNSLIISTPVTNLMFRDKAWRIHCSVGVAYGSDTTLVMECLYQAAQEHQLVEKEAPNQPIVLFKGFGDSTLNFELWCIIKNVNDKFIVVSELYFAIDQIFRKNNITIAFPQRDLHVKDFPSTLVINTKTDQGNTQSS